MTHSDQDFIASVIEIVNDLAAAHPHAPVFIRVTGPPRPAIRSGADLPIVQLLNDSSSQEVCLVVEGLVDPSAGHPIREPRRQLKVVELAEAFSDLPRSSKNSSLVLSELFDTTPDFQVSRMDLPIFAVTVPPSSQLDSQCLEVELMPLS